MDHSSPEPKSRIVRELLFLLISVDMTLFNLQSKKTIFRDKYEPDS